MKSPAVTGYQWSPEAIDAAAVEHQQAVLHHVDLDHRQRRAGLVGHGVHREIEGRIVGQQRAYGQPRVAVQQVFRYGLFGSDEGGRRLRAGQRLVRLLDHGGAGRADGGDGFAAHRAGRRSCPETARDASVPGDGEFAFEHVNESLGRGGAEVSAALELGGVLGEGRAQRGRRVDDRGGVAHAGQRRADKGVRREQEVVAGRRAARVAELVHADSWMKGRTHLPLAAAVMRPS